MSDYPECEKMSAVHEQSQAIGEFLTWLEGQGVIMAKYDVEVEECRNCGHEDAHNERVPDAVYFGQRACSFEDDETGECCVCDHADFGNPNHLFPYYQHTEATLAQFFNIDLDVVETEKRAMLETMREQSCPACVNEPCIDHVRL